MIAITLWCLAHTNPSLALTLKITTTSSYENQAVFISMMAHTKPHSSEIMLKVQSSLMTQIISKVESIIWKNQPIPEQRMIPLSQIIKPIKACQISTTLKSLHKDSRLIIHLLRCQINLRKMFYSKYLVSHSCKAVKAYIQIQIKYSSLMPMWIHPSHRVLAVTLWIKLNSIDPCWLTIWLGQNHQIFSHLCYLKTTFRYCLNKGQNSTMMKKLI